MKIKLTNPIVILCVLAILVIVVYVRFLIARRQAELWQSQGVQITTFDVIMGIRPAGSPSK